LNVLDAEAEVPELLSLPEGEANNVQFPAVAPLLTVMLTGELVAETPARSMVFAVSVCAPFESEAVFKLYDQLVVPDAFEYAPLSTESCTELTATVSEAVPVTLTVPETVAPFAGDVIETESTGLTTLIEKLLEAVCAAESFTCTVKAKDPRTDGVPVSEPEELSVRPVGSPPLARDQV